MFSIELAARATDLALEGGVSGSQTAVDAAVRWQAKTACKMRHGKCNDQVL